MCVVNKIRIYQHTCVFLEIVIGKTKPKHFPFCAVKPLTDEVSTSEQKMNPKREHFSCLRKTETLKSIKTVNARDISFSKLSWKIFVKDLNIPLVLCITHNKN